MCGCRWLRGGAGERVCERLGGVRGFGSAGTLLHTSFTSGMKGARLGSCKPEKVMLAVARQRLRGLL